MGGGVGDEKVSLFFLRISSSSFKRSLMPFCTRDYEITSFEQPATSPDSALPFLTPSRSYSTLLSSLSTHLTTLTNIADEHLRLADSLQAQVIDELRKSGEKKEAGRKKVVGWVEGLAEEREGAEGEVRRCEGKVSFERGWVVRWCGWRV